MQQEIRKVVNSAVIRLQQRGTWPALESFDFDVEYPPKAEQGDYAVNLAMQLAPKLKKNPMEIAQDIVDRIDDPDKIFTKIEAVLPGFVNFFVSGPYLAKEVDRILQLKTKYAANESGEKKKIQVEFISANPTGPLHMGNGRGGFTGDVLCQVLKKNGYQVASEYYLNDRGKQVATLGESVMRRYLQKEGINVDYPEELYQGEYIQDLAKKIKLKEFSTSQIQKVPEIKEKVTKLAYTEMVKLIKKIVQDKAKIKINKWFSEKSLYVGKARALMWQFLEEEDLIYQNEGAWWFRATKYGDEKDRVIVKKDGEPTYFFSDILYLENRLAKRKFDRVIMIWGADHHGDVMRVQGAAEALGYKGKLDIALYQLVRLIFKGKEVKMSKRKGTFVTLEELIDEVGLDATRFFFLMNSLDRAMDFDLNLAKEKSQKNPVYYVQYAHARICNIIRKIPKQKAQNTKLVYLDAAEQSLIKQLMKYPDLVEQIGESYEVHHLPFYAQELAKQFHNFYDKCRVIENDKVNPSRLALIKATRIVLKDVLQLMVIQAPKSM